MSTLTHQNTIVSFNADSTVSQIIYTSSQPLLAVIQNRLQGLQIGPQGVILPPGLVAIVRELLDTIATVPTAEANKKVILADYVFGHLIISPVIPNPKMKVAISSEILKLVQNWEATNGPIHKGTPYYFLAETYLAQGDIPSAYIYFFNAIEQDKTNFPAISKDYRTGAAYLTTSLVDNINNALYLQVVVPLRAFLQNYITQFNAVTGEAITIQMVDQRFLQEDNFEDEKRFFVAAIHEIYHLAPLNSTNLINNDYSKLKISDTLFNLCLIVDQILEKRFLATATRHDRKMANALYQLALHLRWTTAATDRNGGEFVSHVTPLLNDGTPDQVLPSILNGVATLNGNTLTEKQKAVFLAYKLRNFNAHNIEGQSILVTRYPDILSCIMNAFLVAVSVL
jgi:hypothetical protein